MQTRREQQPRINRSRTEKGKGLHKTLVVAGLVLSLVASTASAFTRGSVGGSYWMEGATVHYVNVSTNAGDKGLTVVTREATEDGCATFYVPYDHLGFNAALAIIMTAKMAQLPINLEHRSERPEWNPYACRLTSIGLSATP
jgi:hypothetical protein